MWPGDLSTVTGDSVLSTAFQLWTASETFPKEPANTWKKKQNVYITALWTVSFSNVNNIDQDHGEYAVKVMASWGQFSTKELKSKMAIKHGDHQTMVVTKVISKFKFISTLGCFCKIAPGYLFYPQSKWNVYC